MGSSDAWGYEVPRLAHTHEVVVMDSRGHGRSTRSPDPLTYDLMALDALAVMDALHLKRASVVGASDGGIVGLVLAIHHPERIDQLFAWGANFNAHAEPAGPPDPALKAAGAGYIARMEADYRRLSPTPAGFADLRKALGQLYAVEPDLTLADLGRIRAPTVIADGGHEQFIAAEHTALLARSIPGARLVILPDVSHGGPQQDPAAFHQAVAALLDR
jgi:pimeloyl-ACP methyl ester carboxylesterase